MNRRTFIRSAAGVGGAALLGAGCRRPDPDEDAGRTLSAVGVQLYTLRDLMAEDFEETLAQVASIGYAEVEFAGYFDRSPADVRAVLDRQGLTAPSAHVGIDRLRNDLASVLEAAGTIGHSHVVCPYIAPEERTLDHYRQHAAFFNEVGEACRAAGIRFAYHNHDFEFFETDGTIPYDLLLAETDPDLVVMELDLYWIRVAGHDELAWFAAHPGRFPMCHVKDMAAGGDMAVVGSGTIDFAPALVAADEAGLVHFFVEHDFPADPVQSIMDGYAHISTLRF